MATDLGLVSLTHLHKLAQSQDNQNQDQNLDQLNPNTITNIITTSSSSTSTTIGTSSSTISNSWMWNPSKAHHQQPAEDDDSWEVRAFAEDTGNVMGTTWPPRSYTCAFCRREFRSAQALGGHMNVHRRDRARLHQVMPPNSIPSQPSSTAVMAAGASSSTTASSSFLIPTGEFVASRGELCLLYQLQNSNGTYPCSESPSPSPSTLLSVPLYPSRNFLRPSFSPPVNFSGGDNNAHQSRHDDHHPNIRPAEEVLPESGDNSGGDEELDLELRLGHGPAPS